ncbi:AMPKBI domain-containing protein [Cephalotus follicularis]|uniref:AMPKBI domain-containing protein n=1 Tax=Cephalotus follicularis TaxID=3775 RepID=A0A1Q3CGE4_CEPFO|nr:AMPKBI domain-containing protein [Cephalotus follicularis]
MVMGNASSRKDGEGSSGAKKSGFEGEEFYGQYMEFAEQSKGGGAHVSYHAQYPYLDRMVHSLPHSPAAYQPPLLFTPQVPVVPLPRPNEGMQVQTILQDTAYYEDAPSEEGIAAKIVWSYGGKQVLVFGTWDNWHNREPLHSFGNEFAIIKKLPSGVYHYRFVVDGQQRCAPDLPLECDDHGNAYNILDLQETVPEAPESLVDFESPPSPLSSYNNEPLNDGDFSKNPPDLPPQLKITLLNEPSLTMVSQQFLPRPQHSTLEHIYIQNYDSGHLVALGTTYRFRQKYVTVELYRPSRR